MPIWFLQISDAISRHIDISDISDIEATNYIFFVLYILFGLAVVLGAYWEGHQFDKPKQKRGRRLLFLALLAEWLFGILIFAGDARINQLQRNEIISLQKSAAPRNLTTEQQQTIVSKLKQFASQGYDLSLPNMLEPGSQFDAELISTLKEAGWKLQSFQGRGQKTILPTVTAIVTVDLPSSPPDATNTQVSIPQIEVGLNRGVVGVKLPFQQNSTAQVVTALWLALNGANIETNLLTDFWTPDHADPNDNTIHIIIGSKP